MRSPLFIHDIIARFIVDRRFPSASAPALLAFGPEGDGLRHDLVLAPLLAVFRLPPALLQPSLDDRPVAFAEILPAMFRLFAEHHDIDETDLFLQILSLFEPAADG